MGRIVTLALTLSLLAGVATIALGGVELREEEHEEQAEVVEEKKGSPTVLAAGPPVRRTGRTVTVDMRRLEFVPGKVRVRPGDRIVFRNSDDVAHTVVTQDLAGNGAPTYRSGTIAVGQSSGFVLPRRDLDLRYACTLHPSVMTGRLVVEDRNPA